jgi:hypothetical protein
MTPAQAKRQLLRPDAFSSLKTLLPSEQANQVRQHTVMSELANHLAVLKLLQHNARTSAQTLQEQ